VTGYAEVALLYLERGFKPIPVKGKRPVPSRSTGRHGVVDETAIRGWMADPEWSGQNTALRHEGTVGIDVDDYRDKHGAAQLAELEARLGPLPATPSSTSRGAESPSRQHFFLLPENVALVGKAAPDIDIIQAHHRYSVVWPSVNPDADNAPYVWYDAEGAVMDGPPRISDLEYLPQAWIDALRVDEREYAHQGAQWDGELPSDASSTEIRKLRTIASRLQGLPDVWAPGAGWHETVFGAACWLWRIARSDAYVLTPDLALQLLLDYTPTYGSEWPVERIVEQWESAERSTAGQFEEPPLESRPPLEVMQRFPFDRAYPSIEGSPFVAAFAHVPHDRAAHRAGLLRVLLGAGVSLVEAATLVWHSAASRFVVSFAGSEYPDPHSKLIELEELWAEVDAVVASMTEPSAAAEPATVELPPPPPIELHSARPRFLTDDERARALAHEWWGSRFIDWATATFAYVNMPYYRMNLWTVLSIIFGPKGALPKNGGLDRPLNLYQALVGLTTSGKSEALRVIKKILAAYFLPGENPDVGGDFSNESFPKTLIERDGKATWFHLDEAHTRIPSWRKQPSPYSQIPGLLTAVYDGDVEAVHRNTDKEISGRTAKAHVTVHLMGTPQGMADVMGPEDWESGFLNRFIWAIGDAPSTDVAALAGGFLTEDELDADTEAVISGGAMYQQWAAEFAQQVQAIARADSAPNRMRIPVSVARRHEAFVEQLFAIAARGVYAERLKPTFRRLGETVIRASALIALSSGRTRIELVDLLIAIEFGEEWAGNILQMVAATDESIRTREVNMLERTLYELGGIAPIVSMHRVPRFMNRRREVEGMIDELVAQGRVEWTPEKLLRLRGVPNAA
jgi:hypothetical protein